MKQLALAPVLAVVAAVSAIGTGTPSSPGACSWPVVSDPDLVNVGYPDQAATYWLASVPVTGATELVIRGRFPRARYFSFHAYDALQRPVGAIADHEIDPDAGSVSRFRGPGTGADAYTLRVVFGDPPPTPAPNTLYSGSTAEGAPNPIGPVLYRIYVPDDPSNPTGGVPLPQVTALVAGRAVNVQLAECEPLPPKGTTGIAGMERERSFPDAVPRTVTLGSLVRNPPTFARFYGLDRALWDRVPPNDVTDPLPRGGAAFFSNDHNAYMRTAISRQYGDVVVVRLRSPSFPDTRRGAAPYAPQQLRYWSLCQNNFATQRYIACVADHEALVDEGGYATFVISDVADRPANATAAHGVNWLPWGGLYYDGLLIYRHMLPAPGFDAAIQSIDEGEDAAASMGDYFPSAAYCDKATFESGGAPACLERPR